MNSPEAPDPIDKLLREQDTYIEDEGFTRRVIARLPRRKSVWAERAILLVAAIGGGLMAYFWMPWRSLPPLDYTQIFTADSKVLVAWLPFVVVFFALVSTVGAALRRRD